MTGELPIWRNFSAAIGAETREDSVVVGASGLEHRFLSLSIDEKAKRLILLSAEPDPRLAALVQSDVQSALTDMKVLVARPIILDLSYLAREFSKTMGQNQIRGSEINRIFEGLKGIPPNRQLEILEGTIGGGISRFAEAFQHVQLPVLAQIITVLQQVAHLDWSHITSGLKEEAATDIVIPLDGFLSVDNLAADRQFGICPLPLYELDSEDWELFNSPDSIDGVKARLDELGVYQYFFPPPDQTALGLIDRGVVNPQTIIESIQTLPGRGHPLASSELVDPLVSIPHVIDALAERGYVAEGEVGMEITSAGTEARSTLRYRPREGLVVKLFNSLKLNVNFNFPIK